MNKENSYWYYTTHVQSIVIILYLESLGVGIYKWLDVFFKNLLHFVDMVKRTWNDSQLLPKVPFFFLWACVYFVSRSYVPLRNKNYIDVYGVSFLSIVSLYFLLALQSVFGLHWENPKGLEIALLVWVITRKLVVCMLVHLC